MKHLRPFCFLLLAGLFILSSCNKRLYQKTSTGIRVTVIAPTKQGARTVNLQVIDSSIIRVTASPTESLPLKPGLMCAYQPRVVPWSVVQRGDTVVLMTPNVRARVSSKTGEIVFTDVNGNILLQEMHGGKTFSPITVDGQSGYSLQQVFESPADEAFFGLGQHQSNVFNYKGKNETLYQYNTKVSVPFVVSNKHYGILWDNYSLSRFGDPRPYENLNQFRLFDKQGAEGGLTATYLTNRDPNRVFVERLETSIDYEDLESIKQFPQQFRLDNAAVTWEGYIQPKTAGNWMFDLYYAGYTKVWIDGQLVVAERWRTAWNPNHYTFSVNLSSENKHAIKIEWLPDGSTSYLGLKALSPRSAIEQGRLSLWSEMGRQLDYYFVAGNSADEVVSGYRTLTGKAQVMPKWAMGYWQSRERYKTQEELLSTLRTFRKLNIPIDNIVQDWSYWPEKAWGSHEFDLSRFPDAKAMVKEVHDSSAHIMISVWPKFYLGTEHFKEFDQKGWMYKQAITDSVKDWIGRGYMGSFYDAYNPDARKLYWKQMETHLLPLGFDAWWMDASEPDILSNASMDYRKKLMNPTALGSSTEFFNAYGLVNAQAIYEGQRNADPSRRVFLLTRSGFAGSQRYGAAIWSGDIGTRWEDMKAQITAGMNYSISGNPYWTMDDGGFCVEKRYERAREGSEDLNEWRELNLRWHEFGAFVPLFRSHGQTPNREPWNIAPQGHPVYEGLVYYNQLRYRLMPYIYTLAGMCHFKDYTIMRPLLMDFANDAKTMDVDDQYLFGPSLLVCPVYAYKAKSRSVYFPAGTGWYNLYSGSYTKGGQSLTVDAPAARMPVFVKAGSIVPVGKLVQQTQTPQTDLTLYVYAGQDGRFSLYEDDGTSYGYEKGEFSTIDVTWNDKKSELTVSDRKGQFAGISRQRKLTVVLVDPTHPAGVDTPLEPVKQLSYEGKQLRVALR